MKAHEMGLASRSGLALPATHRDEPTFHLTARLDAVPVDAVGAATEQLRLKLASFLGSVEQWDWPLTFWFTQPAIELPAPPGTRHVAVVLHVVGDGAGRRLARAAEKFGPKKGEK